MDVMFFDPGDGSSQDALMHYGVKRRSGRYPWGSGDVPYQHEPWFRTSGDFLTRVEELSKQGKSELEIAQYMNLSTKELRTARSVAKAERRAMLVSQATSLRDQGLTLDEITKAMGYKNDSSIRNLLDEDLNARQTQAMKTADFLKEQVAQKGFIDVGAGAEYEVSPLNGVSRTKFDDALLMLQMEGYELYSRGMPQVTNPGKQTTLTVLCPPGTEYKDIYADNVQIHSLGDYTSDDNGITFRTTQYPESLDSSRLMIRYGNDGGSEKDGLIEIRRGLDDLSLGNSTYSQVRILVDGDHYLKGNAVYSDDLPDGVDVVFNTGKSSNIPMMSDNKDDPQILKHIKSDPDNPFGANITPEGQYEYTGSDGKKHLGLINKTRDEGEVGDWDNGLPSQFLAKQPLPLIQKQLNLTYADKQAEYDAICDLTNPTVKKQRLQEFADQCDAAAVELKAAALPRQSYEVLIPVPTMADNEVYAPNYKDGETVALVRFPHGGIFEIPKLTVNNKQPDARELLGDVKDAVGINSTVANQLSGADFDGDTVMVLPCDSAYSKVHINNSAGLDGLKDFDPKSSYPAVPGMKKMTNTQNEMGKISNLIMDMTLKGADESELARAVKHSMVVIDAEKHDLNYKQSEIDNNIDELKQIYQKHTDDSSKYGGASTLITRAGAEKEVNQRRGNPWVDPNTGEQVWERTNPKTGEYETKYTGETYKKAKKDKNGNYVVNEETGKIETTGKEIPRTQKSSQMAETNNAYTLSSGLAVEDAYADYANKMKAMANSARKEIISTPDIKYDSTAKQTYLPEVQELTAALNVAKRNAPKEREAQARANSRISAMKKDNPDMTREDMKKARQREITKARTEVGSKRVSIKFTDRQWEAIQAGAVSPNTLTQILKYADPTDVAQRSTPRKSPANKLSGGAQARIKALSASGYSMDQIASAMGISTSTVWKYLNE